MEKQHYIGRSRHFIKCITAFPWYLTMGKGCVYMIQMGRNI